MPHFRKKPVVIEAIQYRADTCEEICVKWLRVGHTAVDVTNAPRIESTAEAVQRALTSVPEVEMAEPEMPEGADPDPIPAMLDRAGDAPPAAEPQPDLLAPTQQAAPTKRIVTRENGGKGAPLWKEWASALADDVKAAPTLEWLDQWLDLHRTLIEDMKAAGQTALHRRIYEVIEDRRGALA